MTTEDSDTKTSAEDVAWYLVSLAEADEESERLSPMRVQKLLYYVQGWSLALRGKPVFWERIKAWTHGPVVPQVFHLFKDHAKYGIPPKEDWDETVLDEETRAFIETVWKSYRGYSAISLSEMTHKEAPWIDARQGIPIEASCDNEITHESMSRFFQHVQGA